MRCRSRCDDSMRQIRHVKLEGLFFSEVQRHLSPPLTSRCAHQTAMLMGRYFGEAPSTNQIPQNSTIRRGAGAALLSLIANHPANAASRSIQRPQRCRAYITFHSTRQWSHVACRFLLDAFFSIEHCYYRSGPRTPPALDTLPSPRWSCLHAPPRCRQLTTRGESKSSQLPVISQIPTSSICHRAAHVNMG